MEGEKDKPPVGARPLSWEGDVKGRDARDSVKDVDAPPKSFKEKMNLGSPGD